LERGDAVLRPRAGEHLLGDRRDLPDLDHPGADGEEDPGRQAEVHEGRCPDDSVEPVDESGHRYSITHMKSATRVWWRSRTEQYNQADRCLSIRVRSWRVMVIRGSR